MTDTLTALELMNPMQLKGKTAAITGSTSGIGLAIAEALAAAGCNIALNGFGEAAEIEKIRACIESDYGVKASYSDADMSKGDAVAAYIAAAESTFGAVDILVNNAGIQTVKPIDEFPDAKWDAIIAINLSSNFHAIKAAVPGMKARNWGRIINVDSAHGLVASPYKSAYVAAKHGVVGLTKVVALELAQTAITCNAVCPGFVHTPLVDGQIKDQAKANNMTEDKVVRDIILESQPSKRFVKTEELAALVLFLCSAAGANTTGTALSMDGGWTAR